MRICVDPGHGGSDPGAIGADGVFQEKEFTLAVALLLAVELELREHEVILTRRQDRTLSLSARANRANNAQADVFVSIHANAAASPQVEGMEVFHFPGSARGQRLAAPILERMLATFPTHRDRGVKEANFAVLRLTNMPAALVECEFLTNPGQLQFLRSGSNQQRLASAIADGIELATST